MFEILGGLFGRRNKYLERRGLIRLPCKILAKCNLDDKDVAVAVGDISLMGMRVESPSKLTKGTTVSIQQTDSNGGPVRCTVVWCRQGRTSKSYTAGLQFDVKKGDAEDMAMMKASWVSDALRQLGFVMSKKDERRKHIRVPSHAHVRAALANLSGDVLTDGALVNLGVGGALVSVKVEVPVNTRIRLQIDPVGMVAPLDIAGVIRSSKRHVRSQTYFHGIRFDLDDNTLVKKYIDVLMKGLG